MYCISMVYTPHFTINISIFFGTGKRIIIVFMNYSYTSSAFLCEDIKTVEAFGVIFSFPYILTLSREY